MSLTSSISGCYYNTMTRSCQPISLLRQDLNRSEAPVTQLIFKTTCDAEPPCSVSRSARVAVYNNGSMTTTRRRRM